MLSKNSIKYVTYAVVVIVVIMIIGIISNTNIDFFSNIRSEKLEKDEIFPGILGDAILKNDDTGIYATRNIIEYDDFRGDVIQGYKANYTGNNGTMVIFVAQMKDNESAVQSVKDMVVRAGYNESANITDNSTVIKLPVENPELFLMQKSYMVPWHYVFAKSNKVYWIGFDNQDVGYQTGMLLEVYRSVAKE